MIGGTSKIISRKFRVHSWTKNPCPFVSSVGNIFSPADFTDFHGFSGNFTHWIIFCRLGEIALRNFIDGAVKTKILSERSEFIFVQRRR